jgi:putative transposase
MRLKKYSSDLSAKSWQVIEKLITVQRKSKWDLQEVVNAILYVTKNGCVWRDLPGEFAPWETVYWYFRKWVKDGTLKRISDSLIIDYRLKEGREFQPSVAIIDSQSTKNSISSTENVGIDGGKLIKGRKRFYLVDTLGNLLDSFVVAANLYDGTTAIKQWKYIETENILVENISKIYADGTFGGTFSKEIKEKYDIEVEIPKIPIAKKGNIVIHEKRWIVERTIAWTNNNRRCAKDYERKTVNSNAFLLLANIKRLAKKI